MNNTELFISGRRICRVGLLGLGKSNLGVYGYLKERFPGLKFTLRQNIATDKIPSGIDKAFFAEHIGEDADEDVIFLSPSARRDLFPISAILSHGAVPYSDAELFFAKSHSKIFAVTGSDGKSTTTALARELLSTRNKALAIGNIGEAMTPHIEDSGTDFVAELSSFQLNYFAPQSLRAIITNISKNHLNWHSSYEEYIAAKENVLKSTKEPIFNYDCSECQRLIRKYSPYGVISRNFPFEKLRKEIGAEIYLTESDGTVQINGNPVISLSALKLKGAHNAYNLIAAMALTHGYYSTEELCSVIESFTGLSHRAESIGIFNGVEYVDSSIDSSPKRTAATLAAKAARVILLLGGRSKGLDFSELCPAVSKYAKAVVISGENSSEIYSALRARADMPKIHVLDDFYSAIDCAAEIAVEGDTVLLSPASTSYDRFKSFEERGECFKKYVIKKHS